jgi:hypothetical protein
MYRDWIIKVLYPNLDCLCTYNALDTCKPKDYKMTFGEWELLAKQGIAEAEYNLGLMFSRGKEVPRDDKKAVKWYRLSAEQRITGAQSNLGLMYEKGQGVEQDYVEAHKWFNISGINGNEIGRRNTDIIEKKMTPGQIAVAVGLTRKWLEKL